MAMAEMVRTGSEGWAFGARWRLLEAARDRIAVADTMDGLIEVVRNTARAVCSSDGVAFVLRDGDKCHYVDEDAVGPLWKGRRFPMETCISGWAMRNGRTAAIPDIFADARIPHDTYRRTFVRSLVMVPVGSTNAVAAIGAYWAELRDFAPPEIATIEALADAIGEAMQRTRAA
ncbi:MAG TPA: GAF domain-containing protein [Rhizomicrobium sp.]|jgi:GAF domain-containing protein|nr:GAF domain-containing protein [Rhizomicrobium sp.]